MKDNNQSLALVGAVFVVAFAIGLSVWFAGNVDAVDSVGANRQGGQPGSPLGNFQMVEEQVSRPDKDGDVFIEEDEVDFDHMDPTPSKPGVSTDHSKEGAPKVTPRSSQPF